jgi:hypothetical protein
VIPYKGAIRDQRELSRTKEGPTASCGCPHAVACPHPTKGAPYKKKGKPVGRFFHGLFLDPFFFRCPLYMCLLWTSPTGHTDWVSSRPAARHHWVLCPPPPPPHHHPHTPRAAAMRALRGVAGSSFFRLPGVSLWPVLASVSASTLPKCLPAGQKLRCSCRQIQTHATRPLDYL